MQIKEKNVLLTRDDVGRAKPHTYNLPTDGFVYGVANKREAFGAGKLTSEWQVAARSDVAAPAKDF